MQILIVEDNPADVLLTKEAFREAQVDANIRSAADGEQALAYLRRQGPFAGCPLPDVILLDLNMPRVNGWEVLEIVKNDPDLQHIPVVVFTSSSAPGDIIRAYRLHANSYLTKPADMAEYARLAQAVNSFWFRTAKLPSRISAAS